MLLNKSIRKRFWKRVDKTTSAPCWVWTGARVSFGYGNLKIAKKAVSTHRISWEIHRGQIPEGLWVLHRCDVPSCVRPSHLFLGRRIDNIRDMEKKGRARQPRGEKHGWHIHPELVPVGMNNHKARLTDDQVLEIRRRYAAGWSNTAAVARELQISEGALRHIIKGRHWKHLLEVK